MATPDTHDSCPYEAVVMVSPATAGGEKKDQDRAAWFEPGTTACICDGVTTSPFAAEAAALVADFSQVLFAGDVEERLKAVSDLLISRRLAALEQPVSVGHGALPAMVSILQEVAREKMRQSFQTTLVAANFLVADDEVIVTVVRCGDSALMAFSPSGELLYSSLANTAHSATKTGAGEVSSSPALGLVRFGPGDTLLARVMGKADSHPLIAQMAGIQPEKAGSWLICSCLDGVAERQAGADDRPIRPDALWLKVGDVLLVPKYLAEPPEDSRFRSYVRLRYSSRIRLAGQPCVSEDHGFGGKGCVTAVLPDHFYTGGWSKVEERFPLDASFVLATDGFYGCFENPDGLLKWLIDNQSAIRSRRFEKLAGQLHKRLAGTRGDDDISFVWVYPRTSAAIRDDLRREGGENDARI